VQINIYLFNKNFNKKMNQHQKTLTGAAFNMANSINNQPTIMNVLGLGENQMNGKTKVMSLNCQDQFQSQNQMVTQIKTCLPSESGCF
jgi:hypothetical protein